jgi:hypothetical protein
VIKAKGFPESPMCIRRFGTLRSDAQSGIFLDKAKSNVENVYFRSRNICQGIVCGKAESKWASNWESVR